MARIHKIRNYLDVHQAKFIEPYKIWLQFMDGHEQVVDFEPFLRKSNHPEIRKYLNVKRFKDFSIANGSLNWNDYDLCFSMQNLYDGTV